MADLPVPFLRTTDVLINKDGTPQHWFLNAWNALVQRTGTENSNTILGIINGQQEIIAQQAADRAAAISRDAALSGSGDGTGTSNSTIYTNKSSSGTSWVTLTGVTVTPTGAGAYTITFTPDFVGTTSDASASAVTIFNGNWRLVEEQTGGGTPVTLDSGAWYLQRTPPSYTYLGEGSTEVLYIPEIIDVLFTGLPTGPVTANYAVQSDIRMEIQRASGSNDATGMSGAISVTWA